MIGCIIQARVGSTRLPKKVLLPINQFETILSFGIKRASEFTWEKCAEETLNVYKKYL